MASDYYPAEESDMSDNSTTATPENSDPMAQEDNKDEGDNTALVPLDFFGGKVPEVGHECTVRVEHVFEDEVELSYQGHEDEETSEASNGSQMDQSMNDLSSRSDRTSQAY